MHSIALLASRLHADFPQFQFTASDDFRWSPQRKTVYYTSPGETDMLLHELSHALLGHEKYEKDLALIEMERDAWEYARHTLAPRYNVVIQDETVQEALDTYRDWLHARSTCPDCQAAGIQTKKDTYGCINCNTLWRVNDARACALRRYKTN